VKWGSLAKLVMPGLVPGINFFDCQIKKDVDGRDIQREDALRAFGPAMTESESFSGAWKESGNVG
jgi:hypothetical protein